MLNTTIRISVIFFEIINKISNNGVLVIDWTRLCWLDSEFIIILDRYFIHFKWGEEMRDRPGRGIIDRNIVSYFGRSMEI